MTDRASLDQLRARLAPPATPAGISAATADALWAAVEAADEFLGAARHLLAALNTDAAGAEWEETRERYVREEQALNTSLAAAIRAYREEVGS